MPFRPKTAGAGRRELLRRCRRGFSRCPRTAPCSRETHGRVPASQERCFHRSAPALAFLLRFGAMKPPAPQQQRPSSRDRRIRVVAAPVDPGREQPSLAWVCLRTPSSAPALRPARLRFKASIRLMTLGGSAIVRGAVASLFAFASTSSRNVS